MKPNNSECCGCGPVDAELSKEQTKSGCCSGAPRLVFACSGASDVGAVADQAARRVSRMKLASMGCLAAVANGLDFAMDPIKVAERIIVIDGCPENCAKLTMERAGVSSYDYILLSELGMEKGHTKVNQEHIAQVYDRADKILGNQP
jgi:uncharacterized metal-binding protein